jgi:hypothetical protein
VRTIGLIAVVVSALTVAVSLNREAPPATARIVDMPNQPPTSVILQLTPRPWLSRESQHELPSPTPERGIWFAPVPMEHYAPYAPIPRGAYLVTTTADWAALWDRAHEGMSRPPLPEIDFNGATIIAVYAGPQPSGGTRVRIRRLIDAGDFVRIIVEELLPGAHCVGTSDTPNPGTIAVTYRLDRPVEFRVERVLEAC